MLTDPRVRREAELLEAEMAVSPEVRRRIAKDNIGLWVAGIAVCVIIGWLAHGY